MTVDDLKGLGFCLNSYTEQDVLMITSALEYVLTVTTLEFDIADLDELRALPACVKLFCGKYLDIMSAGAGIMEEQVGDLRQSFSEQNRQVLLRQYASDLIGAYLKPQARFIPF